MIIPTQCDKPLSKYRKCVHAGFNWSKKDHVKKCWKGDNELCPHEPTIISMTDHVLSQYVGQDEPRRIDDLPGQLVIQVDGDGETVIQSNEKPTQMRLFKGDTTNE